MVKELLKEQLTKEQFQAKIDEMHAHDIAIDLMDLDLIEREQLYHFLSVEQIADIVSYLDPDNAADILEEFDLERQTEIFDEMTVDDIVDILQAYEDEDMRDELIETLEEAEDVKEFILYKEDEVGAYVTNEYVSILPQMDVKEAVTSLIKQAPEAESINTLFVTDEQERYLGAVNLKTLVKARSPKSIEEIMIKMPTVLDTSLITEAVFDMKNYELYELPAVNEENELIGILTLDDILDVAAFEAEEDFEKLAALPSSTKERGILKTALSRLPWLLILMIISIPLISFSEIMVSAISGIALLVFFQPLMLDSPGNVSTQTLAVALKAISNEGKMKGKDVAKEITSGVLTGLILGLTAFAISFIFVLISKPTMPTGGAEISNLHLALLFAIILGGSLTIVVSAASLLAIGIPHLLKFIKVDPAVASGPFITTVIDLFSALVYFGLATLILRGAGLI